MTLVAGASRYINQAAYTNATNNGAQAPNLLGEVAGSATLLDVGRLNSVPGVGLSGRARSLNKQFLQSTSGTYNQLFSASGGGSSTYETALVQIRGLISSVPTSRDTPAAREVAAEVQAQLEALEAERSGDEEEASAARGSILDTNA